jgi:hypothetical protein
MPSSLLSVASIRFPQTGDKRFKRGLSLRLRGRSSRPSTYALKLTLG